MQHIPHTHKLGNGSILNVYNLIGYARNDPRFIAGRTKYDAAGRWNGRGIFKIKLVDIEQIFIDGDKLYTICLNGERRGFGYTPRPEVYTS